MCATSVGVSVIAWTSGQTPKTVSVEVAELRTQTPITIARQGIASAGEHIPLRMKLARLHSRPIILSKNDAVTDEGPRRRPPSSCSSRTDEQSAPPSRSSSRSQSRAWSTGPLSDQQSQSRNRSRSRPPRPSHGRLRSRRSKQAGRQDTDLPEKVSFADAVKGTRRRGAQGATASELHNKRDPRDGP